MNQIGNVYLIDHLEEFCPCGESEKTIKDGKQVQLFNDYKTDNAYFNHIKAYVCQCGNILVAWRNK